MSITEFDRPTLRALRGEIAAALKAVATKHGIALTAAGVSFDAQRFTLKIEGAVIGADGKAGSFAQHAHLFGLAPGDLGKRIMLGGKRFTIVGLRPNARKRPVLLEDANGNRNVVASADSVLRALNARCTGGQP